MISHTLFDAALIENGVSFFEFHSVKGERDTL